MCMAGCARLLADTTSQAEENPGFLDTLLTILENEQNAGIRLSGTHKHLSAWESWSDCWEDGRDICEKEQHEEEAR